ncbi:MAG: histidine phosphatase family protein [Gammaproteobacteria bacterium]|nr:histidine phosphatase family protein [Gammaproteobacteria bacterium]
MKRELLLVRHGKVDRNTGTVPTNWPLRESGERAAQRVGTWLLERGLVPGRVVSSPAEQALATAERVSKAMGLGERQILQDHRILASDPVVLLEIARAFPTTLERGMIVGHNPGLELLLEDLVGNAQGSPDVGLLPMGAVAWLAVDSEWQKLSPKRAHLIGITRPSDLPRLFPFPGPGGNELRKRPAYYYTQSSVIPYRVRQGKVEILVTFSRKNRYPVVPKGIKEPGLTHRESAAQEALEEAGIEGVVGTLIGRYHYRKWGGSCQVDVYSMKVVRELPESEWQEHERGREWVTPERAIEILHQPALGPMVEQLVMELTG